MENKIKLIKEVSYKTLAHHLKKLSDFEFAPERNRFYQDFCLLYMPLPNMKNFIVEINDKELIDLFNKASKNIYRKRECWIKE